MFFSYDWSARGPPTAALDGYESNTNIMNLLMACDKPRTDPNRCIIDLDEIVDWHDIHRAPGTKTTRRGEKKSETPRDTVHYLFVMADGVEWQLVRVGASKYKCW